MWPSKIDGKVPFWSWLDLLTLSMALELVALSEPEEESQLPLSGQVHVFPVPPERKVPLGLIWAQPGWTRIGRAHLGGQQGSPDIMDFVPFLVQNLWVYILNICNYIMYIKMPKDK